MSGAYWVHVLHVLTWGYSHVHGCRALFRYWLHHHAVAFLRSGVTSGGWRPGSVWWLAVRHVSPVDW